MEYMMQLMIEIKTLKLNYIDSKSVIGTTRRKLRNNTRNDTKLNLSKVISVTTLLYESEIWVLQNETIAESRRLKLRC